MSVPSAPQNDSLIKKKQEFEELSEQVLQIKNKLESLLLELNNSVTSMDLRNRYLDTSIIGISRKMGSEIRTAELSLKSASVLRDLLQQLTSSDDVEIPSISDELCDQFRRTVRLIVDSPLLRGAPSLNEMCNVIRHQPPLIIQSIHVCWMELVFQPLWLQKQRLERSNQMSSSLIIKVCVYDLNEVGPPDSLPRRAGAGSDPISAGIHRASQAANCWDPRRLGKCRPRSST